MSFTNAKQSIPPLFVEIIRNHDERKALAANPIITMGEVRAHHRLKLEMDEYRRGAEKALKWNTDKGSTA